MYPLQPHLVYKINATAQSSSKISLIICYYNELKFTFKPVPCLRVGYENTPLKDNVLNIFTIKIFLCVPQLVNLSSFLSIEKRTI